MDNRDKKRWLSNTANGFLLGALFFFGGLFVTVYTWGFGAVIGRPMMLAGIALPIWMLYKAKEGENWTGTSEKGGAVMNRNEARKRKHESERFRTSNAQTYHL